MSPQRLDPFQSLYSTAELPPHDLWKAAAPSPYDEAARPALEKYRSLTRLRQRRMDSRMSTSFYELELPHRRPNTGHFQRWLNSLKRRVNLPGHENPPPPPSPARQVRSDTPSIETYCIPSPPSTAVYLHRATSSTASVRSYRPTGYPGSGRMRHNSPERSLHMFETGSSASVHQPRSRSLSDLNSSHDLVMRRRPNSSHQLSTTYEEVSRDYSMVPSRSTKNSRWRVNTVPSRSSSAPLTNRYRQIQNPANRLATVPEESQAQLHGSRRVSFAEGTIPEYSHPRNLMSQHEKHANKIRRPCPACGQQKWLCANTALSRGKDQKPIPRFTIIIEDKDRYRLYKLYAALTRRDSGNPENAARKYITLMLTPRASSTEDVVVKVPVTFKSQDREPYVYICNQKMIEIAKGFKEEVKQVGRGRHPGAYLEDEAGGFICSCFFVSTKTVGTRNV